MLKQEIMQLIEKNLNDTSIELFPIEKAYIEEHHLISKDIQVIVKDEKTRFKNAYIERSNKETETVLSEETPAFLNKPLRYLEEQLDEFIYLESDVFHLIGIDAISLEVDDVFGVYSVLFGLKLSRSYGKWIKEYLEEQLQDGEIAKFSILYNHSDGMWDINFSLDYMKGFSKEWTIGEAFHSIYRFIFKLQESMEKINI